ncbi:hypothetical protein QQF54_05430 [Lelliottia sp. V106_10]|uniref:hypothetical protein n=1 Tax=Lelliottia wanjuensis TaxID=3050585 RepID=UPI00254BD98F|nr:MULTISPECIES: hypothetical protein [unclassified Lelliottia]MDK9357711.1 hypothetical protein [Lelliottia sp. V106_16]MDK9372797.1 hypothetical protein [Lelliottia sp. V106_10]MDK9599601.1 hypothetical protein [Lelliottia sp. V106_5]
MNNKAKMAAHSQSINKVVTRFEGEFGVKAAGLIPTEKLESLIALLKLKSTSEDEDIDALILEAFSIGARAGFYRALTRFEDGKITTRKVPNEDRWTLYSSSKIYRITKQLPSTKNQTIKAVATLSLSENGFE